MYLFFNLGAQHLSGFCEDILPLFADLWPNRGSGGTLFGIDFYSDLMGNLRKVNGINFKIAKNSHSDLNN